MRWAVLFALAATAWADGKFISTAVPVVEVPDQQAILVWKDGRERLVIDTAFSGQGDLAWLVPLPAPPKIEPVSPAVFRTIEVATMPALAQEPNHAWRLGLYLLVAIALLSLIPLRRTLVFAAAGFVFMVGGALIFLTIFAQSSGVAPRVTVLGRKNVGSYETATLQSVDAVALLAWLEGNGFNVATEARAGIEEYVRDGWAFAVARVKPGGSGGRAHPLSFTFEAKAPVYPLRLTGTQDRPLSLRLFVLSDRRARCEGLEVESCFRISKNTEPRRTFWRDQDEDRSIGQPELLAIMGDATVLTTLRGDLAPERMRADLYPVLEEFTPLVPQRYTEGAALSGAASTATWVALALLLPCAILVRRLGRGKEGWRRAFHLWVAVRRREVIVVWCAAIGVGIVAGVVDYATTDVAKTRTEGRPWALMYAHSRAGAIVEATNDMKTARAAVAAYWRYERNPFDGGDVREEPSPGNYGLEERDGKVLYVPYDSTGLPMR